MPKFNRDLMYLELERSRIKREKSKIVLNKSLFLYFAFLLVGVVGISFDFIDTVVLNSLILAGIFVLVVGTVPYLLVVTNEEKKINRMIEELK